jgi:Dolichyl-phosphate-mannose-protein mannosyltransferase
MRPQAAAETGSGQVVAAPAASARRLAPSLAAAAGPVAVLAAAASWTLLRGVDHRFISFSDGVYTYVAAALAERGAQDLYGSIVLSQPPGIVLGATLLWKLSPHVETVRLALALLGALTALLTYGLGRALGFRPGAAVAAALLALTAPIHAQFSGLDGEAVLTPLALCLALALERRKARTAGVLLGLGFLFKLTWTPFAVFGLLAVARRDGPRAALRAAALGLASAAALLAPAVVGFGWHPGDLVEEVLRGQSHSGLQAGLAVGLAVAVVLLWWPLLVLAPTGLRSLGGPTRLLTAAGAVSALFMVKQGTFFNVLDPLEPFLALAAVAGAAALWQRRTGLARLAVVASVAGLAVHAASLTGAGAGRALPFPLGAGLVETDDQGAVDRAAAAVAASSRADEPVLVNPFLALVAGRRVVGDQADWFILHALARGCGARSAPRCGIWAGLKETVRRDGLVVSVDSNVADFDPSFRTETGTAGLRLVLRVKAPPLDTRIFAR